MEYKSILILSTYTTQQMGRNIETLTTNFDADDHFMLILYPRITASVIHLL
jgi:hypothetical protein